MPHVSNLTTHAYSIWGRRLVDGVPAGREEWIDEIAAGGAGEFPDHGDITVRDGTAEPKGARVLGPLDTTHVVITGHEGRPSRNTALWVGCALLVLVLLALLAVFTLLMVTPH